MNPLSSLIEFFIGIAGFSGIIVALSGASVSSNPLDRFRVLTLLGCALGGGVFAALPLILVDSGGSGQTAWAFASGPFALSAVLLVLWGTRHRRALPAEALERFTRSWGLLETGGFFWLRSLCVGTRQRGLFPLRHVPTSARFSSCWSTPVYSSFGSCSCDPVVRPQPNKELQLIAPSGALRGGAVPYGTGPRSFSGPGGTGRYG